MKFGDKEILTNSKPRRIYLPPTLDVEMLEEEGNLLYATQQEVEAGNTDVDETGKGNEEEWSPSKQSGNKFYFNFEELSEE